ncbi:hypothetical protein [Yoonia sediminilitoris]|uniref:Uncharacterized protein n=1 Tax=Yoonia sediminilitoris TaxID=1286148 RepID=A0A2T6KM85_9RHOB|nr:hypothetical protein [Yoonia sediminilitoris]PUB17332.1 hypothetical protein C8N45_102344 [Yoonia sediminilitoris]RCW97627.1 hypothetical protein DFP92_102344 [Yoonia sediminilitoris]
MTDIPCIRARRFHGLYALLTGDARTKPRGHHDIPDHLSQDLGLPEATRRDRPISHLGLCIHPVRPQLLPF